MLNKQTVKEEEGKKQMKTFVVTLRTDRYKPISRICKAESFSDIVQIVEARIKGTRIERIELIKLILSGEEEHLLKYGVKAGLKNLR